MSVEPLFTDWHGCYDGNWNTVICQEAFAHPAKFSRGLVERIVRHGLQSGYWLPGDLIGDCFGGVGLGGIISAYHGLRWVGVELEPRFFELAQRNFAQHRQAWLAANDPAPVILNGDSRQFAELVGQLAGTVTGPPYSEGLGRGGEKQKPVGRGDVAYQTAMYGRYGSADGQIERLPPGTLDAAITSPPFSPDQPCASQTKAKKDYHAFTRGDGTKRDHETQTPGQINGLRMAPLDGAISSPPYENSIESRGDGIDWEKTCATHRGSRTSGRGAISDGYGEASGQIGSSAGETYWQAMAQVYAQMRLAMKPGAVAAIVVKDYVSKARRVLLCDDTCRLLESLGFTVFERTRCHLVKRQSQPGLFGGTIEKKTERKSFFRRLHEKKLAPDDDRRIDWEEVIWARV